jgi:hypothetical protein
MTTFEQDLSKEFIVEAPAFEVCSYRNGPAHSNIPCSEVHVVLPLPVGSAKIALRLKSPRALDVLVGALLQHRKDVWP